MEEDTKKLLRECGAGCKMGINSMEQVREYVKDEKLGNVIDKYLAENKALLEETEKLLAAAGGEDKEPGAMASAFSWFTTEMKLMMKDESNEIAKIMMDGSNMGIQSLCKYMHEFKNASQESMNVAKKLVAVEEAFMKELQQFM